MKALHVELAAVAAAVLVMAGHGREAGEPRPAPVGMFVIEVPGIPGPYCAYGIEKRLREQPEVADVVTDWKAEELRVRTTGGDLSAGGVAAAVEASEYPYDYRVR